MLFRVRPSGSGTLGDPHRIELPYWSFVSADPGGQWWIVYVPDREVPPEFTSIPGADRPTIDGQPTVTRLTPPLLDIWRRWLDKRNPERAGMYSATVV